MTMPPRPSFMERSIKRLNRAVSEVNKHQKQHDTSLELLSEIISKHDGNIDKIIKTMDDISNVFQASVSDIHVKIQGDNQVVRKQLDDILIMVVDVYTKVYNLGANAEGGSESSPDVLDSESDAESEPETNPEDIILKKVETEDICAKLENIYNKLVDNTNFIEGMQSDIDSVNKDVFKLRDIQDAILNAATTTYELLEAVKVSQNKLVYDFDSFKSGVEDFHEHILSKYVHKQIDDSSAKTECMNDAPIKTIKTIKRVRRFRFKGCCMQ